MSAAPANAPRPLLDGASRTGKPPRPGVAAADGATHAPKRSKKRLIVLVVVLVVVLGGFMAKSKLVKPHYAPGEPVPAGQVFSLGTLTVNTADGHLAQVGIALQLTKPADVKSVQTDEPAMKNAAIAAVSSLTYTRLLATSGKAALRHRLLTSFQKILGTVDGAAEQVTSIYFTTFLLQ